MERLALGDMPVDPESARGLDALHTAHLLTDAEPTMTEATVALPAEVLIGRPDDATLGARVRERVAAGAPSTVLWIDERGAVIARDDGDTRGCPLCAWLQDSALTRYALAGVDLREVPCATADADRLRRTAATLLADEAAVPRPREVMLIEPSGGAPTVVAFQPHAACVCADRAPPPPMPAIATFSWLDATRRHAPVWALQAGAGRARVGYRRTRTAWTAGPDAIGMGLGSGSDAQACALGEAIERFCMLHAPPHHRDARALDLDVQPLAERDIRALLYRDEEYATPAFRFRAYDPSEAHDWCIASSLDGEERRAVPASLVGHPRRGSRSLTDGTSNGYAAHTDRDAAIAGALLELVERDAVLLDWYTPCGVVIRVAGASAIPGAHVLVVTQDIDLPVVLVIATRADGALRCGSAADVAFDAALSRAETELRVALEDPSPTNPPRAHDDASHRYEPADHVDAFGTRAMPGPLDAMLVRSTELSRETIEARWPSRRRAVAPIAIALASAGLTPWLVDRGLPETFGPGWHVVRALVPGLVELSWGLPYRRLASPRLRSRLREGAHLSSTPHPIA